MISDLFRLDGRVAIVTGASSGLGVDIARGLAEAGASVVLAARRLERLEAVADELRRADGTALAVRADVSSPAGCAALAGRVEKEFGRLDVLINNAGVATAVPASRETPEQWQQVIDLNLSGCYWMCQAVVRLMAEGSSIVNISSITGLGSSRLPQAAYSASKAGLIGLTRDLAHQWSSRRGIRVNAVAPGFFESEMTAGLPAETRKMFLDATPLGRPGRGEELASVVLLLASPAGGYVNGATVVVDGGYTIY